MGFTHLPASPPDPSGGDSQGLPISLDGPTDVSREGRAKRESGTRESPVPKTSSPQETEPMLRGEDVTLNHHTHPVWSWKNWGSGGSGSGEGHKPGKG